MQKRAGSHKGQMSIFIIFGLLVLIIVALVLVTLNYTGSDTSETLAKIESLDQASDAVESCVSEFVDMSFLQMGEMSGYLTETESFSSFGTATSLLPIESMEDNLVVFLERQVGICATQLKDTPFEVLGNGRPSATVELGESVTISVESIGLVQVIDDPTQTQGISSIQETYDINFVDLHSIVDNIMMSEYGVPVEFYEGFVVNTFTESTYSEQLIRLHHNATEFTFRITKLL